MTSAGTWTSTTSNELHCLCVYLIVRVCPEQRHKDCVSVIMTSSFCLQYLPLSLSSGKLTPLRKDRAECSGCLGNDTSVLLQQALRAF